MEEKKDSQVSFRLTKEEHRKLKILAATEGKTIKTLLFEALDKLFPTWRNENSKEKTAMPCEANTRHDLTNPTTPEVVTWLKPT